MPIASSHKSPAKIEETPAVALANNMLKVIDELAALMGEEADLVEARKITEHGVLLRRKQKLTIDYRAGMKQLANQPDMFKQLPESLRLSLKGAAQKLADVTERNARHLRGAVMAVQRLVRTFVELVREEVVTKPGYNNARAGMMQPGNYETVCKPVVIDRIA